MSITENERVAQEIAEDMKKRFDLKVENAAQLHNGWLNVKWRMSTDRGPLFVKYYHPERYKLHRPEKRKKIERTLQLQQWLHNEGVPCPGVLTYEGAYIQETAAQCRYAVLDWVEGHSPAPGEIGNAHMFELGRTVGRMHRLLGEMQWEGSSWQPDRTLCLEEL